MLSVMELYSKVGCFPVASNLLLFSALQRRLDVVIWQHVLHFYNILAAIISEGSPNWSPMSRRTGGGNTIYGDAMNGCT